MSTDDILQLRRDLEPSPTGDTARQAVNALRGYAYQLVATVLAWLDIEHDGRIYLEVAEDYAILADRALRTVQVKDTKESETVTLNSSSVQRAIAAFVELTDKNPDLHVYLRFLTTSVIGTEHALEHRPAGMPGLKYWQGAASRADVSPLRATLESDRFPESVRDFCRSRNDPDLRRDMIRKIDWDCGNPNFPTLRHQLEARLTVLGRDLFQVPAADVPRLADQLISQVLDRIVNTPDRTLTRDQLYKLIERSIEVSVPRTHLNRLLQFLPSPAAEPSSRDPAFSDVEPRWLIDDSMRTVPQGMISRSTVECALSEALRNYGVGVLVGASGVGKSIVSMATAQPETFIRADLENTSAQETCQRLDMLLGRIGGRQFSILILDDVNQLDDKDVVTSLSRVIAASRRCYRDIILTCYRPPSTTTLATINVDPRSVIECPCFSEEETSELVRNVGGDPKKWGRLAFIAAAAGHPQLAHAFVMGMASRDWPDEEIAKLIHHGFSSSDIDAAREAARRNIANALPETTRSLLYRLSLVIGPFNRSLALTVGLISPQIPQPGESMDQLIGPWIEPVGRHLFRVSPLAADLGRQMLTTDTQAIIHNALAVEMLRATTVDASALNFIIVHALAGKATASLATIAQLLVSADPATLEGLAEHLLVLRLFKTDLPIYDRDPLIAALLRLAQFKIVATASNGEGTAPAIYTALVKEVDAIPDTQQRSRFEAFATLSVLCTIGVANHISDWVRLLSRVKTLIEANGDLQTIMAGVAGDSGTSTPPFYALLFRVGIQNLASVERLEHIFKVVDGLDPDERALWLTPIDDEFSDYYTIINQPWVIEDRRSTLNASDAAACYARMAQTTQSWGVGPLGVHCSVAQAIMLNEYQNDGEGALSVLEDARAAWGDNPVLSRALANYYQQCGEHARALELYEAIAADHGTRSSIERLFRVSCG